MSIDTDMTIEEFVEEHGLVELREKKGVDAMEKAVMTLGLTVFEAALVIAYMMNEEEL